MIMKHAGPAMLALLVACGGGPEHSGRGDSAGSDSGAATSASSPSPATGETPAPANAPANANAPGTPGTPGAPGASGRCVAAPITGNGIGTVRLGMKADSLRAACAGTVERREPADEGTTALVLDVPLDGEHAVAEIDVGQVWRIQVRTPGLRTADGIGVGSTLRQLLTDARAVGMSGEGRLFVMGPARCGLSFQLAPEAARALPQGGDAGALRRLPPNTPVTRILVVGCRKSAA